MNFEMDRDNGDDGEPSLKEMTRKAVQILSRSPEGFLLMVEGEKNRR
jgi:alkaline phosphatase